MLKFNDHLLNKLWTTFLNSAPHVDINKFRSIYWCICWEWTPGALPGSRCEHQVPLNGEVIRWKVTTICNARERRLLSYECEVILLYATVRDKSKVPFCIPIYIYMYICMYICKTCHWNCSNGWWLMVNGVCFILF